MVLESDPYLSLGLMPGSPLAEVKRRYRQLAKQYHPDSHGQNAGYAEKLRDLNAAYAFLSDPTRKAVYDARVNSVFDPARAPQPMPDTSRRRNRPSWAAAGLALLMLVSTGAGVLISTVKAGPSLAGLFPQMPGIASARTDGPAPVYSFMPTHGTFDDPNNPNAWSQTTQR